MKSIRDFNVKGKRILVRCDFNAPMDSNGNIEDDFRIDKSLPTIEYLIKNQAKVVLMSHLDPKSQGFVQPNFTLKSIAKKLSRILKRTVQMADDCVGQEVSKNVKELNAGEVLLLENLRFHKGETENSIEFAKKLSELGDIYINDAFSTCHRAHASIVLLPKFLPCGAGLLLLKEIESLEKVLKNPARPFLTIIGGIKAETKAKFIDRILKVSDLVIVSGLIKKEMSKKLKYIFSKKILGPTENLRALDISEKTIEIFRKKILSAKTVLWNGPFGKFEDENYKKGTLAIANAIIESGAFSVAGGGETVEFLSKEKLLSNFSHVSTGGGAMLSYLAGEELPGLKALEDCVTHS